MLRLLFLSLLLSMGLCSTCIQPGINATYDPLIHCHDVDYPTYIPNGRKYQEMDAEAQKAFYENMETIGTFVNCLEYLKNMQCSSYFLECDSSGKPIRPCRKHCFAYFNCISRAGLYCLSDDYRDCGESVSSSLVPVALPIS